MVAVQRYQSYPRHALGNQQRVRIIGAIFILFMMLFLTTSSKKRTVTRTTTTTISTTTLPQPSITDQPKRLSRAAEAKLRKERLRRNIPRPQEVLIMPPKDKEIPISSPPCPYESISDMTEDEIHPKEGKRHMVTPPQGGTLTLVCCHTTKGPMNIAVHSKWAPNGSQRFLEMVRSGYFNDGVPMMRCIEDFICQFGLAAGKSKFFGSYIEDDPNWLPAGPTNRQNKLGVDRFAQGYLSYAGNNVKSRSNQFIMALKSSGPLGGGSPWEIPWGELVGVHSFDTMSTFYSGYGEGPPQEWLWKTDGIEKVKKSFPMLDFINSCHVADQRIEE